ncbi:AB hydrolase superfamily protein [Pleurotus pulmonarius]
MDPSLYKDFKTSRGFDYHYLAVEPQQDRPYLLLLHGFPSTSYDWRHQVAYFKDLGYGLIVPDMLGYGGTSIPTDPEVYRKSLICKDIIEILDKEDIKRCFVVGHDWGSIVTARLADLYEDRFIAFAFIGGGYTGPRPEFDLEQALTLTKKIVGYELIGYWKFFSEEDAPKLIEENFESFFSLVYAEDASLWKTNLAPTGVLRAWIESGKTAAIGPWVSEEEGRIRRKELLEGGLAGPLCWYKVLTSGSSSDDDKGVAIRSPAISKPVFLATANRDAIGIAKLQIHGTTQACPNLTIREFDAGHWLHLEKKDEVNQELGAWLDTVILAPASS